MGTVCVMVVELRINTTCLAMERACAIKDLLGYSATNVYQGIMGQTANLVIIVIITVYALVLGLFQIVVTRSDVAVANVSTHLLGSIVINVYQVCLGKNAI